MTIFSNDGRLIIPLRERKKKSSKKNEDCIRYIINEAYCPAGCSLIDKGVEINGFPGIRIKFERPGMDGEFVISSIEGDFDKVLLRGTLEEGVKDDLYCPHCGVAFEKLVNCDIHPDAEMVVIGLTPQLDYNNAITICNVTGCSNGAFIHAGEVLKHVRLSKCC